MLLALGMLILHSHPEDLLALVRTSMWLGFALLLLGPNRDRLNVMGFNNACSSIIFEIHLHGYPQHLPIHWNDLGDISIPVSTQGLRAHRDQARDRLSPKTPSRIRTTIRFVRWQDMFLCLGILVRFRYMQIIGWELKRKTYCAWHIGHGRALWQWNISKNATHGFALTNLITNLADAQASTGLKLSRSQTITKMTQEQSLSRHAISTQAQKVSSFAFETKDDLKLLASPLGEPSEYPK